MQINKIDRSNINFQSAQLNIAATADNHGSILSIPHLIKTVQENSFDIFEKSDEKSTMNLFAIAGDYFMYPEKQGLLTKKDKTIGDIQFNYLARMILSVKNSAAHNARFDTVFTPGNHDLEAGDKWLYRKLSNTHMTTVMTNVNISKSPLVKQSMKKNSNMVTSKIYEIPDDKNPEIINKVLVLGATIPREKFNSKRMSGTVFYDLLDKSDSEVEKQDFTKTYSVLKYIVKDFKEKNPDGSVILLSHLGNKISSAIAEEIPDINLILNAHDHKKSDIYVNNTLISSLGDNNKFMKSFKLKFDDFGKLEDIHFKKYDTKDYKQEALQDKALMEFVKKNIGEDIKPIIDLKGFEEYSDELVFDKAIRHSDKVFVNYTTTAIKEALRIKYKKLDAVGIPSEMFRGGIMQPGSDVFTNLDLIKLFGGANEELSNIRKGSVTGEELVYLITQNVLNNIDYPKQNGIIHWSDIKVNRTLMEKINNYEIDKPYKEAIEVRNPLTGVYEPVRMNKFYTIVLPDKYINKNLSGFVFHDDISLRFMTINDTFGSLFRQYLSLNDNKFELTPEVTEKRII